MIKVRLRGGDFFNFSPHSGCSDSIQYPPMIVSDLTLSFYDCHLPPLPVYLLGHLDDSLDGQLSQVDHTKD